MVEQQASPVLLLQIQIENCFGNGVAAPHTHTHTHSRTHVKPYAIRKADRDYNMVGSLASQLRTSGEMVWRSMATHPAEWAAMSAVCHIIVCSVCIRFHRYKVTHFS